MRGVEVRLMDESDRGTKDAKSDFERDCAGGVKRVFLLQEIGSSGKESAMC